MDEQLQQAITAIKSGDKAAGRRFLTQILKSDPKNEHAWLWMTQVLSSNEERIKCLQNVLKINPSNETAKRGLATLQQKQSRQVKQASSSSHTEKPKRVKPLAKSPGKPRITENFDTKKCPYCAEIIKTDAIKCRFCGQDLRIQSSAKPAPKKTKKKRSRVLTLFGLILIVCVVLCICPAFFSAIFTSGPGQQTSKNAAVPTSTPGPIPTPTAFPQGSISVTRQQIIDEFPEFDWNVRDFNDGTHLSQGLSPDKSIKINLFSAEDLEDMTEASLFFNFPHEAYYLEHIDEDSRFKNGYDTMMKFQTIIFPDWNSDDWVSDKLRDLPEPLADWEIDERTEREGVEVWLGVGDLSETEYTVSFDVVE